jgi:SpoU rRNA Methylase family
MLHGGVVALAQPRPVSSLEPVMPRAWAGGGRLLLLLDGVGNPHNLGAIARTAAFFGVPRIVLSDHSAQAGPSDASYRVAEGGLGYVELYRGFRFTRILHDLRASYPSLVRLPIKGNPSLPCARENGRSPCYSVTRNAGYPAPPWRHATRSSRFPALASSNRSTWRRLLRSCFMLWQLVAARLRRSLGRTTGEHHGCGLASLASVGLGHFRPPGARA